MRARREVSAFGGTSSLRWGKIVLLVFSVGLTAARGAAAQQVLSEPEQVVTVAKGQSALLTVPARLTRVSVGDPGIAEAVVVSPREVLVNGKAVGTTSLFAWDETGRIRLYALEVRADVAALERQLRTLFPGVDVNVTSSANAIVLTGTIRDPGIVRRILEIAQATGATVINNIQAPSAQQILLHVQFAEVNRTAVERLGVDLSAQNPQRFDREINRNTNTTVETLSSGMVRLFLLGENAQITATINALRSHGDFRSLAEPNLVALEGQEATFLAGGEFPYPAVQGGNAAGAVGIQFREFGVRLRFTPRVTNNGSIRLHVAPEVSSLDFANGVTFAGFQIPSLLTRRTESEVELRPGQHLAIAGLLDNNTLRNVDKIPFLGDLPILGALFQSRSARQGRTELLVVITPHLVQPSDAPPPLPTGDPNTWKWDSHLKAPPTVNPTTVNPPRSGSGYSAGASSPSAAPAQQSPAPPPEKR